MTIVVYHIELDKPRVYVLIIVYTTHQRTRLKPSPRPTSKEVRTGTCRPESPPQVPFPSHLPNAPKQPLRNPKPKSSNYALDQAITMDTVPELRTALLGAPDSDPVPITRGRGPDLRDGRHIAVDQARLDLP